MRSFRPLPRRFYEPSAKVVAPALLGHWLIRNTAKGPCGGAIVEAEAYLVGDPACHGVHREMRLGAPLHRSREALRAWMPLAHMALCDRTGHRLAYWKVQTAVAEGKSLTEAKRVAHGLGWT
jgi:hypothetical protein